jgi:CRP/FNR family transcriptional regulator, cyclic AMP receptor protein
VTAVTLRALNAFAQTGGASPFMWGHFRQQGFKPLDATAKLLHRRRQSSVGAMMVLNSLAAHPCFKTLDPESCRILDRHCVWVKTPAGAWVVGQSANDRDVYFIMTGRLRGVLHGVRQDLTFNNMEAGSFFGEMSAFDGAPRAVSVFAVNDSLVARMPCTVFIEALFTHRPLGEAVVAALIARVRELAVRVGELGALDVRSRVHAELLRLARPDRENPKRAIIHAPPNQSELASRINTRRETVSREINAMEREGLIERRRGAIVINDALRLSARIEATALNA